ncbi:uracil-DNA glycosylase [Flexivirga alba]|uniref:Uracil-DNA glycosylase n=1 Tax=Flexivirga alba TaxID=702742 RepID=A0ABW2AHX3_9MICO
MSDPRDASRLPEDWAGALVRHGFDRDVDQLVSEIYESDAPRVFPPQHQVFRAFHLTKLESVRVVILGQDPYPQVGQANGLAFSVPARVKPPRSLGAIYRNLEADPDLDFSRPADGDLSPWAKQGVLLLNTALTVEEGTAGSAAHRKHWERFTDRVLQVVNEECDHVAFLLWGSDAIDKVKKAQIGERHKVIQSAHPAAWTSKKETLFKKSHPFSDANEFLRGKDSGPVNWDLTATH